MENESIEKAEETMEVDPSEPEQKNKPPNDRRQREDFTSEKYKIEINNLPKYSFGVSKSNF